MAVIATKNIKSGGRYYRPGDTVPGLSKVEETRLIARGLVAVIPVKQVVPSGKTAQTAPIARASVVSQPEATGNGDSQGKVELPADLNPQLTSGNGDGEP